ncbi:hypothetical protein WJX82_007874 [Trebouxia sp. C0006]
MPDADDGVIGHLGPVKDVDTHELILTRNKGDERTECKPSLVSEQQLNPEAHYTQKQLSSHNLTLSHKKESTQFSKAEACWHKHRYTNRLLILTSFITMWVGLTNIVPLSILQFVTYCTGLCGVMAAEIFKPRQQALPAQQQAQMMLSNFLTRRLCGYLTAAIALLLGLATIVPAALHCYAYAEAEGKALLDANGTDFRRMVLGGWLLTHAAVSYYMVRISNSIIRILSSDCSAENDVPVTVVVDSQSTSLEHIVDSCMARSQSCSW